MKPTLVKLGLACLSSLLSFGCSGQVPDEGTSATQEEFDTFSCGTATRDAVVNSTLSQIAGVTTPTTYDNPGCTHGYIVEFDGTVNGVHYGYRPETPRIGFTDGIHVDFPIFHTSPGAANNTYCVDNYGGIAELYEKQSNGTWLFKASYVAHSHNDLTFSQCIVDNTVFKQVKKGTASEPHIYRVAVTGTNLALAPNSGWGPIAVHACDVNHPC